MPGAGNFQLLRQIGYPGELLLMLPSFSRQLFAGSFVLTQEVQLLMQSIVAPFEDRFDDGLLGIERRVLRQCRYDPAICDNHAAGVGLLLAGDHFQERGLA